MPLDIDSGRSYLSTVLEPGAYMYAYMRLDCVMVRHSRNLILFTLVSDRLSYLNFKNPECWWLRLVKEGVLRKILELRSRK
jgi:hypothetical protein